MHGGCMVCVRDSGSNSQVSSPGWGHCVEFLCKALNSYSVLSAQVYIVPANLIYAGGNPAMY